MHFSTCRLVLVIVTLCGCACSRFGWTLVSMKWWRDLSMTMQPQSPRPPSGVAVKRRALLHPADRLMLQAVRDNLSHVRQPRPRLADTVDSSQMMHSSSTHVPSDSQATGSCSRLNYNKKAMDKIRQSLQSYHVTANYDNHLTLQANNSSSNSSNAVNVITGDQGLVLPANKVGCSFHAGLVWWFNVCYIAESIQFSLLHVTRKSKV